ncbi:hypothetical protein TNCV_4645491 [Trichonephila clavipes]|nr:hypothetical protein TNCV_4645491 [Trichonephila clavipes]
MMPRLGLPCEKIPTLLTMKRMNTRTTTTTTKIAKVHQMLTHFLRWRQLWSSTNNNQSAVLLNYCCSRELDLAARQRRYAMVQR